MPGDEDVRESLFGESVTLDELESQQDEPKKGASPEDKFEGDDIPESYRGKNVKEIIAIAELAREGMKTSDSARAAADAARSAAESLASSRGTEVVAPKEEPELTREQLQELYEKDPLEAIAKIEEQAMKRIAAHVESRIAPLTSGTTAQAENWARQEFPDEFELFEKEIKKLVDSVPNKTVFTSKQGWEDAVSYVRGQKNNFEKLVDHRADKKNRVNLEESRGRERNNTGFSGRSTTRSGASLAADKELAGKMNEEQRSIAQRFIDDGVFKDFKEYNSWYNRGEA
jgi:hypothetical protein